MKMGPVACAAAVIAALLGAGAASAHHSFAMFDQKKPTTVTGVVHEFQWTNPHSFIELDVIDPQSGPQTYAIEMNSPNNLTRQGWKSTSLKAGDKANVIIAPLRDGGKGGLFVAATLPDGKIIGDPTRAGVTTNVNRP